MKKRNLRQNNSGQVIVITSLLIALVLLSTAMYVIQTDKNVPSVGSGTDDAFSAYQQSIRNTLVSALSNETSGGGSSILANDLDALNSAISLNSYQDLVEMNYTLQSSPPYQNGVWISWDSSGYGISRASANFVFSSLGSTITSDIQFEVNVTSEVNLVGSYLQFNDTFKQVNLNVNLLNEGKPALAQNLTFSFENSTNWVNVDSPRITDFDNGTYSVSFIAETGQITGPLIVSANCVDQRCITVGANVTCNSVD